MHATMSVGENCFLIHFIYISKTKHCRKKCQEGKLKERKGATLRIVSEQWWRNEFLNLASGYFSTFIISCLLRCGVGTRKMYLKM